MATLLQVRESERRLFATYTAPRLKSWVRCRRYQANDCFRYDSSRTVQHGGDATCRQNALNIYSDYVFTCVCLSVRLFVCQQTYSKTTEQIFMKFYGKVEHNPWTNRLDFEW